ncbi:MAG: peptide chain release factor aRF-1 [Candidatus Hodarchaeales archaeon]
MSSDSSFRKYRLRTELNELKSRRSQDGSTCLVSLYIPENKAISDFTSEITNEIGTAANIKSKTTRKNVITALQIVLGKLKLLGQKSPPNGVVIFSGVTTTGKPEIHVINPPNPVSRKLYVCDSFFHTDGLEEHMVEKESYGMITLDTNNATIAVVQGSRLTILKNLQSMVMKKHRAGGQSSVRFARLREESLHRFLKKIAELSKDYFIESGDYDIKGLIIGGPGPIKEKFVKEEYLDKRLNSKVMKIIDIGYSADKTGMKELVDLSQDVLEGVRFIEEKKLVQKWQEHLMKDTGLAVFGENEVRDLLQQGAVDILLLSEDVKKRRVYYSCEACGTSDEVTSNVTKSGKPEFNVSDHKCKNCTSTSLVIDEIKDLIVELGEKAESSGSRVEIISSTTEEGQILLHFGGIVAILRYNPNPAAY